jgi:Protein of unknown function (DUF2852)
MTYDKSHPDWLAWAKTPGFNPLKLLTVLAGFAIFPPLGVAALVYFLWTGRRSGWHGGTPAYARSGGCSRSRWRTGNEAFDEHRAKVMRDLAAEREAFEAHRAEERRKRDQADYDAFRAAPKSGGETQ